MVRAGLLIMLTGCVSHLEAPSSAPHDARGGLAPRSFDAPLACGQWTRATHGDGSADTHVSFPEDDRQRSCFVPVRYDGERVTPGNIPSGCGYRPKSNADALEAEARRYERIAAGDDGDLPLELACKLPLERRRAAARNNARTLHALAQDDDTYAYAAIEAFGFGHPSHQGTWLDRWTPGEACPRSVDLHRFDGNALRAGRAALAFAGHVAPVVIVSGGAVHSALVEAFLLDYIATCRIGLSSDRVLLDPCANHTHTNVRNAGRIVRALGGRTSYIVTDESFQALYLQEHTALDTIGGSIDQRSLRDWGYLLGSWRQASDGIDAGFWYTPYRFWADPRWAGFSCLR